MIQLDLFSSPPKAWPFKGDSVSVDPDGRVCTDDEIEEAIHLGDWHVGLRIELAIHNDLWMWGSSFHTGTSGCGYRVGPKWGKFAETRDEALSRAVTEVRKRATEQGGGEKIIKLVNAWQKGLTQ